MEKTIFQPMEGSQIFQPITHGAAWPFIITASWLDRLSAIIHQFSIISNVSGWMVEKPT
jgi:hypothetical protein